MTIELKLDDDVLSPAKKEAYRELARRILIAYLSWHTDVAYATTAKQVEAEVGDFWYVAAAAVVALWAKRYEYGSKEPGPETIQ